MMNSSRIVAATLVTLLLGGCGQEAGAERGAPLYPFTVQGQGQEGARSFIYGTEPCPVINPDEDMALNHRVMEIDEQGPGNIPAKDSCFSDGDSISVKLATRVAGQEGIWSVEEKTLSSSELSDLFKRAERD